MPNCVPICIGDEDKRLVVKPLPSKPESFRIHQDSTECARDVIHKLLIALAERYDDEEEDSTKKLVRIHTWFKIFGVLCFWVLP